MKETGKVFRENFVYLPVNRILMLEDKTTGITKRGTEKVHHCAKTIVYPLSFRDRSDLPSYDFESESASTVALSSSARVLASDLPKKLLILYQ